MVKLKLVGKNLSVLVSNVYAPNDHNEEYFDHLKDIMLDIQIVHPTLPVLMLGDFNIVLENRDSITTLLLLRVVLLFDTISSEHK